MAHIQGTSRDQIVLFPESIDDYVEDDNPVRFIDAFKKHLKLCGFAFRSSGGRRELGWVMRNGGTEEARKEAEFLISDF